MIVQYLIYSRSFAFWIVVLLFIIFLLWLFFGGGDHEFVGLEPLIPNRQIAPYIRQEKTRYSQTAEDLWSEVTTDIISTNEDPSCVDTTPQLPECIPPTKPPAVFSRKFESKRERKCREVMQKKYQRPFPKIRPTFLRNPETGCLLELDCYNEDLKIAVEYNGIQHYVWPNFTNQSYEAFIKQRRRDQLKVDLCDLQGVYLITVPYNVPIDQIEAYINYYLPENVQQRIAKQ
jgi:hypothetical protein